MRRQAVGFVLVALTGCFDSGVAPLRCSTEHPGCPDGFICVGETCQAKTDSDDAGVDRDQGSNADLIAPSGCANGAGFAIGGLGCWGCAGIFNATNKASALCASGFVPPINGDRISDSDCAKVGGGFFFSALYGATDFSDLNFSQCGFANTGVNGFFGCGVADGSGVVNPIAACSGFRPFIQCRASNGVTCPKVFLDAISNTRTTNGAICCPK